MKKSFYYESSHDKVKDLWLSFVEHNSVCPAHFHRSIELIYVTDGTVRATVNDQTFIAEQDDIIFMHPCNIHSLVALPDFKDYILIIKLGYSDDFDCILKKETLSPFLSDKPFNRLLLPFLKQLQIPENSNNFLVSKGFINVIFGKIFEHYPHVPIQTTSSLSMIVNVLNYIDEHYTENLSLDSIASVFGYNKYYFSKLFNTHIGETLNSYINTVRINNLVRIGQKQDNLNLSRLVFDCGFDSMSTFYRNYFRLYDVPPKQLLKGDKL